MSGINRISVFSLLLLAVFISISFNEAFPQDTINVKYFPLAIGNVYKYIVYPIGSPSYYYKIRITKDTIISSKRYFGLGGFLVRYDSASANVYQRYGNEYCPYSPFEKLLDSLKSRKNDTTVICYSPYVKFCTDTSTFNIFGYSVKTKRFRKNNFEGYEEITYGYNFGIVGKYFNDYFSSEAHALVGCYVNGVLYGDTILTDIEKISSNIPDNFILHQNYPNPFNPVTKIKFEIPKKGIVNLTVHDLLGREISTLVNEVLTAGIYETEWSGSVYPSGMYYYRLQTDNYSQTKKMVLIK